jgi:hypothetical protein
MKILFLHPTIPDYVGDGLFHGLRALLHNNVIDFPKMDYMYADYDISKWKEVANEGKVLYGHLIDNEVLHHSRVNSFSEITTFDAVIISQPYGFGKSLIGLISKLRKADAWKKLIWVDGSDDTRLIRRICETGRHYLNG